MNEINPLTERRNEIFRNSTVPCEDCKKPVKMSEVRVIKGKHYCLEHFMKRNYSQQ